MAAPSSFTVLDYILFALTLFLSTAIGVFYAFRSWRAKSGVDEYLAGSRRMPLLPTAMSLLASYVSGISIIAYPIEVYKYGLVFVWFPVSAALAIVISGLLILPVMYRLKNTISCFAYFQHRFDSPFLRSYVSLLNQLTTLVYVSVVLYTPAIALAGVTGIDVRILIVTVGLVCTLYTTIGGLKAVVWTDFFQVFVMYAGLLALAVKGTMMVGGFSEVFEAASKYDRVRNVAKIDPNPLQYMTVWTAVFGGFFYWLASFGPSQITLQRYCSLPSLAKARTAILLNVPSMLFLMLLVVYIGVTMAATEYAAAAAAAASCDDERVSIMKNNKDQLLIAYMMHTLEDVRGLPGLFVACIFSGTLSSVSSGINSLCAVFLEDVVKPFYKKSEHQLTDRKATVITKIVGVFYGLIAIGLTFAAAPLGGIYKAVMSGVGGLSGPMAGMFLLGIMFPRANRIGTFAGSIIGLAVVSWMFVGATVNKVAYPELPSVDTSACSALHNVTTTATTYDNGTGGTTNLWAETATITPSANQTKSLLSSPSLYSPDLRGIEQIYAMPNIMYPCIGALLTVASGLLISLITNRKEDESTRKRRRLWTMWSRQKGDQCGDEQVQQTEEQDTRLLDDTRLQQDEPQSQQKA